MATGATNAVRITENCKPDCFPEVRRMRFPLLDGLTRLKVGSGGTQVTLAVPGSDAFDPKSFAAFTSNLQS